MSADIYFSKGTSLQFVVVSLIQNPELFLIIRRILLEIFLVILIAGLTSGITGMIVAVPFYTAVKVIAKESLSEYKIVKRLTRDL